MKTNLTIGRLESLTSIVLYCILVVVLIIQTRTLYTLPIADSARWWGDETGQITELKTEIREGFARIPTAIGSSVAVTNGIVRGNSWLAAAIYGLPAIVFERTLSEVQIGRTISFLFALALLGLMRLVLKRSGTSNVLIASMLVLLASSRAFLFASHSARLDMAAGFALLGFIHIIALYYEKYRAGIWKPNMRWWFLYGFTALLLATLSIHLLTLLFVFSLFAIWQFRLRESWKMLLSATCGVACCALVLLAIYLLSGSPVVLLGFGKHNQFVSVASGLPILRPFSRSVQVANLIERIHGLSTEAPWIMVVGLLTILLAILFRKRMSQTGPYSRFILLGTFTSIAAWLFLQSPAIYYYMHILPLVIVSIGIALDLFVVRRYWRTGFALAGFSVLIALLSLLEGSVAAENAYRINQSQKSALAEVGNTIRSSWNNTYSKPLVLSQNPALDFLLSDASIRVMNPLFLSFPLTGLSPDSIVRTAGVNYLLLFKSGSIQDYSIECKPLAIIAEKNGSLLVRKIGYFTDVGLYYFNRRTQNVDTLELYRLNTEH